MILILDRYACEIRSYKYLSDLVLLIRMGQYRKATPVELHSNVRRDWPFVTVCASAYQTGVGMKVHCVTVYNKPLDMWPLARRPVGCNHGAGFLNTAGPISLHTAAQETTKYCGHAWLNTERTGNGTRMSSRAVTVYRHAGGVLRSNKTGARRSFLNRWDNHNQPL